MPEDDSSVVTALPQAFLEAVNIVLMHEGIHADDPDDAGGDTWFGIARNDHPNIPWPPTRDQAIRIYFAEYWEPHELDALPVAIAAKVFDIGVDIGIANAIICLQRACRACGRAVPETGYNGPLTKFAARVLAAQDDRALLAALKAELEGHYRMVAQAHPNDQKFLAGWLNRTFE